MSTQIVTLKNSHSQCIGDVLFFIAKGIEFSIWMGSYSEKPNWKGGQVSLSLTVGKRKRLIRGKLRLSYDYSVNTGFLYSYTFLPTPRFFSLKERIQTRMKAGQVESRRALLYTFVYLSPNYFTLVK